MKTRSVITVGIAGIIIFSVLGIVLNPSDATHESKIRLAYFPNIGHAIPIVGIEKDFFAESMGEKHKSRPEYLIVGHR